VKLTTTPTKQTARTQLAIYKTYAPNLQRHGFAFRVLAFGPLPSLRLRVKGWLYKFVPATNRWQRIRVNHHLRSLRGRSRVVRLHGEGYRPHFVFRQVAWKILERDEASIQDFSVIDD
jgi:hypothetical protein